ncbi:hypothetical protein KOR34_04940 [Posidoniimonas corsicana]|uniref:SF3 helicase domain-containing protein n=1 Tax=Posidoniimonas corsicana TaxID=1938618 RepID=A0A5C5VBE1_9BACT|nr:phage/plasmid primase, P4 family [Posidoniimonas corsicana]TWT35601.1 hypothetical protein KOR34_04940 [Posidoniimonas corsicana]
MSSAITHAARAGESLRRLFPAHIAELKASGISEDQALEAGVYSEHDQRELARLANRKRWGVKLGAALVFEYRDLGGNTVLHRLKPERPAKQGGRELKYIQPSGERSQSYFPPGVAKKALEPGVMLAITEGEKKALSATIHGLPCVGLSGVWNFKPGGKVGELLPELELIDWRGRPVYIAFDSDVLDKEQVRLAEQVLAATLQDRGAEVKVCRIPAADDGSKQGLDDIIVARGRCVLDELLNAAAVPEPVDSALLMAPAKEVDGAREAAEIVDAEQIDGVCKLIFWSGQWWHWAGGRYVVRRDDEIRAEVVNRLSGRYAGVRTSHVGDVLEHLKAKTVLSSQVDAPTWLKPTRGDPDPSQCIPARNGIIDLAKLYGPDGTPRAEAIIEPTPRLLSVAACDYRFDPDAPEPAAWLAFLDSIWGDDPESVSALQEMFGYLLTADTSQQTIFLLVGPTRSGKGTIGRVIHQLVGKANTCGPTLAGLASSFGLASLIGKSVAVVSDARVSKRADSSVILERLLSISGEDTLSVPVKFKEDVNTKLPTRLVILSNELPQFADASSSIAGRFLVLKMSQSFLGKEDRSLDRRLAAEMPGILLWACEGWRRLNERGGFMQPESGQEAIEGLRDLASPIGAFLRDRCEIVPGGLVAADDLFAEWTGWLYDQGYSQPTDRASFGRDLAAAAPTVRRVQRRSEGGKRERYYQGAKLRRG